jgi:cytochrome P450
MQSTHGNAPDRTVAPAGTDGIDPFELPDTIQLGGVADPYPQLAVARRRSPVLWEWPLVDDLVPVDAASGGDSGGAAVNVLGHDEVVSVLRDHEAFSSTIVDEVMGAVIGPTMVAMDEPEHRARRALVARAFGPKLLARWQDDLVRRVLDDLIDGFVDDGRVDLVRRLTFAFPVRVIARILGLPERDAPQFQRWSIELISAVVNWDRGMAASAALGDYFAARVAERRSSPTDDVITELATAEIDGERLSDAEIFGFLRLLLPAGIETTYRALGNLLFALLTHPDQLDAVTHSPELRPAAIEEGLRWETPLVLIARQCVRDAQVGGVDVRAGTPVNVFIASANRDERRYEAPERFDVHRSPAPHVSFGSGPHTCLGIHLARMELTVALDALLERLPGLRLDPDAPQPQIVGSIFRSPDALPVRFGA